MKKIIVKTFYWILIISYLSGCTTTEIVQYKADLNNRSKTGTLTVMTKDSTEYVLDEYRLDSDTVLAGSGMKLSNGSEERFRGTINIKDIIMIEGEKTDITKTVLGLGAVGLFLIFYLDNAGVSDDGHTIKVSHVTPGGIGSCK